MFPFSKHYYLGITYVAFGTFLAFRNGRLDEFSNILVGLKKTISKTALRLASGYTHSWRAFRLRSGRHRRIISDRIGWVSNQFGEKGSKDGMKRSRKGGGLSSFYTLQNAPLAPKLQMSNGFFVVNGSYPTLAHNPCALNPRTEIRAIIRLDTSELVLLFVLLYA